jgi:hypothetical protein
MMHESTKFSRWVKSFGVLKLSEALTDRGKATAVSYSAVYRWTRGENEPRGPKMRLLVELSKGELSHQDVHDHFAIPPRRLGPRERARE